jgi:DNA-binding response OmpR family regulator
MATDTPRTAALHILVLARDPDLCDAVMAALKEAGEDALCVNQVTDAVQRLETEPFDAAVIEAVPPHLTAHQAARDAARIHDVPCIAVVSSHVPADTAAVLHMPFKNAS